MIKAVIFDFGGVIGLEGYWTWIEQTLPDYSKEYFSKLADDVDRGDITEENFVGILAEKTLKTKNQVRDEVFDSVRIDTVLLELISGLRKEYKTGLLTNFVNEWMLKILETHALNRYFDSIVISSQERLIKPDPRIFHKMLVSLSVRPHEAVFVDDREPNIKGANDLGMKGLLYLNADKLRADLLSHGVNCH